MSVLRTAMFAAMLLTSAAAIPQQSVPPPPKPADAGPSLADTMKFIQDKLNDIGPLSFTISWHNSTNDNSWTFLKKVDYSAFVADPNSCKISWYSKNFTDDGTPMKTYLITTIRVTDIQQIVVEPFEQHLNKTQGKIGQPNIAATGTTPSIVVLSPILPQGRYSDMPFFFEDQALADRVAKAMQHAVELCGVGNKDPF